MPKKGKEILMKLKLAQKGKRNVLFLEVNHGQGDIMCLTKKVGLSLKKTK